MLRRMPFPLITFLVFLSVSYHSANAADTRDLLAAGQNFQRIEQLLEAADTIRPWEKDGLNRRIDQLGLAFITQINETAVALLSEDDVSNDKLIQLNNLLDTAMTLALSREEELEQRVATERDTIGKFEQSAQADIARAFMEDLLELRERYLFEIVVQLDTRRAAGQDIQDLEEPIIRRVLLFIDGLTGQIRLDAMSLDALGRRLIDKPLDDNVKRAIELVKAKQSQNIEGLEGILEVASRLGIDTAEQRSLIIQERGRIGIDIFDGGVFGALWNDAVESLRDSITRSGPDLLLRLLVFSLILTVAWVLARLMRYPLRTLFGSSSLQMNLLLREAVISLCSFLLLLTGVVAALASAGVSLGPILAGLGVLGIVVGLAIQDSLGNLAAGAMILVYRPYDMDDHVLINGAEGLVKRMNLLATTVSTFDNQSIIVPNGRIWSDTIINYTAHHIRRIDIKVNIAFAEDPERVQTVIMDVLKNQDSVLDEPEPTVHMAAIEESSVTMMVKPWVHTTDYWSTYWDLTRLIKQRLDSEGIEIPFPQRVVTLAAGHQNSDATTAS